MFFVRTLFLVFTPIGFSFAFGAGLRGNTLQAQEQQQISKETILKAWQRRQDDATSFRFACSGRRTLPKEYFVPMRSAKKPPPSKDLTFDTKYILTVDANKMRFEFDTFVWDDDEAKLVRLRQIKVFDETESRGFTPTGPNPFLEGYIYKGNQHEDVRNVHAQAILLHYRPLQPQMGGFNYQDFSISPQRGMVKGRNCVILKESRKEAKTLHALWIDTEHDCSIVRFTSEFNGHPNFQVDIDYKADSVHGWVPSMLTATAMIGGILIGESFSGSIDHYSINSKFDPREFKIEFPPGTRVVDWKKNGKEFIVKDDLTTYPAPRPARNEDMTHDTATNRTTIIWLASVLVVATICILAGAWYKNPFRRKGVSNV